MKNITISKPNSKGQVVIPKEIRDELGINSNVDLKITSVGRSIFMYPVTRVMTSADTDMPFPKILEMTKGAWANDKEDLKKARQKRALELAASKRRKKAW